MAQAGSLRGAVLCCSLLGIHPVLEGYGSIIIIKSRTNTTGLRGRCVCACVRAFNNHSESIIIIEHRPLSACRLLSPCLVVYHYTMSNVIRPYLHAVCFLTLICARFNRCIREAISITVQSTAVAIANKRILALERNSDALIAPWVHTTLRSVIM